MAHCSMPPSPRKANSTAPPARIAEAAVMVMEPAVKSPMPLWTVVNNSTMRHTTISTSKISMKAGSEIACANSGW